MQQTCGRKRYGETAQTYQQSAGNARCCCAVDSKLSLPGRAEQKLGRAVCCWELVGLAVTVAVVAMSETKVFVAVRVLDTDAPGAYIVAGVETFRVRSGEADVTEGDKDVVGVRIEAQRGNTKIPITLNTVGQHVQGGPQRPDDATVAEFFQRNDSASLPTVTVNFPGANLIDAHKIPGLDAPRPPNPPPQRINPERLHRSLSSYSSKSRRKHRRSARYVSASDASESDGDSDSSSSSSDSRRYSKVHKWKLLTLQEFVVCCMY